MRRSGALELLEPPEFFIDEAEDEDATSASTREGFIPAGTRSDVMSDVAEPPIVARERLHGRGGHQSGGTHVPVQTH